MKTQTRCAQLDTVLRLAQQAFHASTRRPDSALAVATKIFSALETPGNSGKPAEPATLPVCEHIAPALGSAHQGSACIGELADAFEALAPRLEWWRRPGAAAGEFYEGHANARLVGPRGMEQRDDVLAGASLVAPGVRYPDHHHPPEEIYVVLTPGEWRQESRPWHEPGVGAVVHNPPGIVHAMRAGDTPLLALWFLWLGRN
jgi:hypothetical protein